MANLYDVGDLIRCATIFTNSAGTVLDPDVIKFQVRDPSGNLTNFTYLTDAELVKDSTGTYHADVAIDEKGDWWYRFYGLTSGGTAQGASENWFRVSQSRFVL